MAAEVGCGGRTIGTGHPLRLTFHLDQPGAGLDTAALLSQLQLLLETSATLQVLPWGSSPLLPTKGPAAAALAHAIAGLKIRHPHKEPPPGQGPRRPRPLPGEVDFELRRLAGSTDAAGVLYDGFALQQLLQGSLDAQSARRDHLHVVLTNRFVGSHDATDRRWHARMVLIGQPTIVSTTGMVLAPALPREFYEQRHRHELIGSGVLGEHLRLELGHHALQHDDPRQTTVATSLVLQALSYWTTGEAFCADQSCRLQDVRTQHALVTVLCEDPRLCAVHQQWLQALVASGAQLSARPAPA